MNKIKKIIAVASVFAIMFSFAACNGNKEPELSTTLAEPTKQVTGIHMPELSTGEPETNIIATEPTSNSPVTEQTTEKETEVVTAAVNVTQPKPTEPVTKPAPVIPSSKSDIVKLYNDATSSASKSKPGYSKTVNTVLSDFEMGALSRFDIVRDTIGTFLGEGKSQTTVSKGNFDGNSLVKSTIKADDVSSATCTLSPDGKYYVVKITLKNETNPLKGNSGLGRFTKDYKDANEIKSGIEEVGASVSSMSVKTSSVVIEAKISVENNRFSSLKHSFKMSAEMTDVKYSVAKVKKASAKLATTVTYSSFKY